QFKLAPGNYNIVYRFVGYREKMVPVTIADHDERIDVKLDEEIFSKEDTTTYNRKTDRGMAIMQQVLSNRERHMNEFKTYTCQVYIKGVQRLTKAPKSLMSSPVIKQLDLDSAGRGILYQSESLSQFNLQRPDKFKEITIASKNTGGSPAFSYNKASDLQLNIYQNIFYVEGLRSRGFVSPVADNAFQYYRYRLTGTTVSNNRTIHKIAVLPKSNRSSTFRGFLYIVDGDWRVYSADLYLTEENDNINLIDTLSISQQYIPVRDSVWLPASIQYDYKGSVLGFKFAGYYVGIYNNYKIDQEFPPGFFNGEVLKVDTAANSKPSGYWATTRPVPLTPQETRDYRKKDSLFAIQHSDPYLDSVQLENNKFSPLSYTIFGYEAKNRRTKESFYVAPLYLSVFYNTVEGWGIDERVKYTKKYDDLRQFSIEPVFHYGFSSKLVSPNVHAEYLFDPLKRGRIFTNFGAEVMDLNNVGTRSLWFNTLSSLLYENNYVKYYRNQYGNVGYERELANGILWTSSLEYSSRRQLYNTSYSHIFNSKVREYTSNNPLALPGAPANDQSFLFPEHQALTFKTSLEFTFGQRYITRPDGRTFVPSRYPKVVLNYRKGINGAFGSDVNYDFVSVDISQDHIQMGLTGYSSFKISAGDFLNRRNVYFMDYNHFLGNQGTTFDPTYIGSFHFLPFYQFSTNAAFLEAHYQHNFAGALFSRIPFMRKLKLEEIVGANYLTEKFNQNYSELYVGIQRLFFRVDYGISFTGDKKYIQGFRIFYGIR
ncbi:MAG: carboxypeptidase-like regulatory domain-containing protein, partial [Mucilaginibacter sp.]|nr:carboxypeptidase-like regulatory domain-containing protein [Mucilaginibacter sp.]